MRKIENERFQLAYAKLDPSHCLASGLFRSLAKGEQEKKKLRCWWGDGAAAAENGTGIEFVGPDALGPLEMRVLQVVAALAGRTGDMLPQQPVTDDGKNLRAAVDGARDKTSNPEDVQIYIKTSYYEIAKEIGRDPSGADVSLRIRKALERLADVGMWAQVSNGTRNPIRQKIGSILNSVRTQGLNEPVLVSINAKLSTHFLQTVQFTKIELGETRQLSDPAAIIHQRLCGVLDPGKKMRFGLEKLASYAWPAPTEDSDVIRKRRQLVRRILGEIRALGWGAEETEGVVEIRRPALIDMK